MTFDKSILFDITPLSQPLIVNLPNSYKIRVEHTVKVALFPDMTLNKVLYVPSFKFNLLSVHQFCYQFGYDLTFSAFLCFLQGHSLKKFLGLGKLSNSLYLLQSLHHPSYGMPTANKVISTSLTECISSNSVLQSPSVVSCHNVWHVRLGHMHISSMKNINCLPQDAFNKSSIPYTLYPLARKHKLYFSSSSISSSHIFYLIDIDTLRAY